MKLSKPAIARRAVQAARHWPLLLPHGRARIVSLVLGVLVLLASVAQVAIARITALPDNAALRVGDTVITEEEFQRRVEVLEALYGVKSPGQGPKLDRFQRDAAKSIAVTIILDGAAQERGVAVAEKQARDALTKIIGEQLDGGRDAFVQFLSSQGIAEHDVLDEVKRQLATSRLFEQVTSDVRPVADAEVRQHYQDNKNEMVQPERRHLRNIVVRSRAKASDVLRQARAGTDFAKLVSRHSLDASTKNKGGDLGTLTADQFAKNYADAAFAAGEEAFFGPIKTQHGWNVGQVVGIEPAKQLSFKDVRKQLEAEFNNKRQLDTWRTWLGNEIEAADVEYADNYQPANPDAPPADAVAR